MKGTILLMLVLVSTQCFSQIHKDSIIVVKNWTKFIALSCILREDLIKYVKEEKTAEANRLKKVRIYLSLPESEHFTKNQLITSRERIMVQFFHGELDDLLKGLKYSGDYFLLLKKHQSGNNYMGFECGNLTVEMLDFWKKKTDGIISTIETSALTIENKEVLSLYWKTILLYIEADELLPPDINESWAKYLEKYPATEYKEFVERLASIEKFYRHSAFTCGFGFGKSYPNGHINDYLKPDFSGGADMGYTARGLHILFGFRIHGFHNRDTMQLARIDTVTIDESSAIRYNTPYLEVGYSLFSNEIIKLKPFIRGNLTKLTNHIKVPDTTGITQRGIQHPKISVGMEAAFRLVKDLSKYEAPNYYSYSRREETDKFIDKMYLTIRCGYYPKVFNKPTGISGNVIHWTIGLEWLFGTNRVHYKHQKANKN